MIRMAMNMYSKMASRWGRGIYSYNISELEYGTKNSPVNLLKRLTEGMRRTFKIQFVPKQKIRLWHLAEKIMKLSWNGQTLGEVRACCSGFFILL